MSKEIIQLTESDLRLLINEIIEKYIQVNGKWLSDVEFKKLKKAKAQANAPTAAVKRPVYKKKSTIQKNLLGAKESISEGISNFKSIKYIRGFLKFAPTWFGGQRVRMLLSQKNVERKWYNCQRLCEQYIKAITEVKTAKNLSVLKIAAEGLYIALDDAMNSINNFLIEIQSTDIRQIWNNDPIFAKTKYGLNDIEQQFRNDVKLLPIVLNNWNKQFDLGMNNTSGIETPLGVKPIVNTHEQQPTTPQHQGRERMRQQPLFRNQRPSTPEEPMKSPFKNTIKHQEEEPNRPLFKW